MLKSYLFVYSNKVGTRDEVKELLNSMSEVSKWRFEIQNSFFIVSSSTANELVGAFRSKRGSDSGHFLFSEIPENKEGWLSMEGWHLINKKEYKPKEE